MLRDDRSALASGGGQWSACDACRASAEPREGERAGEMSKQWPKKVRGVKFGRTLQLCSGWSCQAT